MLISTLAHVFLLPFGFAFALGREGVRPELLAIGEPLLVRGNTAITDSEFSYSRQDAVGCSTRGKGTCLVRDRVSGWKVDLMGASPGPRRTSSIAAMYRTHKGSGDGPGDWQVNEVRECTERYTPREKDKGCTLERVQAFNA